MERDPNGEAPSSLLSSVEDKNNKHPPPTRNDEERPTRDVRFIQPLLQYGYKPAVDEYEDGTLQKKPLLLYLPGFDGTFLCPFLQFPELSTTFDVRCMMVGPNDRSTFDDMKETVLDYLRQEVQEEQVESEVAVMFEAEETTSSAQKVEKAIGGTKQSNLIFLSLFSGGKDGTATQQKQSGRPVYLIGESFGGILACEVAVCLLKDREINLKGLALINSATCFDRSRLAVEGPAVAGLHPCLYFAGLLKLLPSFTDEYSWEQLLLILRAEALPGIIDNETREAYMGRVAFSLPFVIPFMPQKTMEWRLREWLEVGCSRVRLSELAAERDFRTLIVAGEKDLVLPSIAEAERLASVLPNSSVHVVEGAGHASTCGSRLDLTALLRNRFPELRRSTAETAGEPPPRIAMKEGAAAGKGIYFGMEPRYDNPASYDHPKIGLNPIRYWNKKYYRKIEGRKRKVLGDTATVSREV
jgi:pimeloyl-ACP methyl ester carboxylesterase